jgi:ABC-type Zn uptake system ZnuABC Zn-binding protein ZnuA
MEPAAMTLRRTAARALIACLTLIVAACSAPEPGASGGQSAGALRVVATTTVLADLVAQVGRENVTVHSLVPKGGEAHTFDPTPSDATTVSDADLLVMNGLGLDDWLGDLATNAGADDIPVVVLAEDLDDVTYLAGDAEGPGE